MMRFDKPKVISDFVKKEVFRLPSRDLTDKGKVQLGGLSPAFRKLSIEDKGKVRLGGLGPVFR